MGAGSLSRKIPDPKSFAGRLSPQRPSIFVAVILGCAALGLWVVFELGQIRAGHNGFEARREYGELGGSASEPLGIADGGDGEEANDDPVEVDGAVRLLRGLNLLGLSYRRLGREFRETCHGAEYRSKLF